MEPTVLSRGEHYDFVHWKLRRELARDVGNLGCAVDRKLSRSQMPAPPESARDRRVIGKKKNNLLVTMQISPHLSTLILYRLIIYFEVSCCLRCALVINFVCLFIVLCCMLLGESAA